MKRLSSIVFIIGVALFFSAPAYSATLCVNPGGTPPCYGSIQAAIDAANPGDTIQVWVGTYFENRIMVNKDDLTILGVMVTVSRKKGVGRVTVPADPKKVIVDAYPNSDGFIITGNHVTIKNLTVRFASHTNISSGADNTTLDNVRVLSGGRNIYSYRNYFTLKNSLVSGAWDIFAVEVSGDNTSITGNRILNNDNGVFNNGQNATVQNNEIIGVYNGSCIHTNNGNNNLVTDNTIADCYSAGIYSYHTSNTLIARNTLMNTGTYGIHLNDPRRSLIQDNVSSHPTDRAYYSYSYYTDPAEGNTFTNNTASNMWNYGYHIQENNPTITNNTAQYIYHTDGYHISCYTTCTGGTISNNYSAYSFSGYNLDVDYMNIEGNTAEYSRYYGFRVNGHDNDIMNNTARYNGTHTSSSNGGYSIWGYNNYFSGNLAEMNNSKGILVNSSGGVNTVTGNTVRDNYRNGLVLENSGGSSDVTDNIVINNEGEGIANHAGTVNTMTGNTVTGNRVGVDICNNGTITIFTGNTHTSGGPGTPCPGL